MKLIVVLNMKYQVLYEISRPQFSIPHYLLLVQEGYKATNLTTSCSAPFVATLHKNKLVFLKFMCVCVSQSFLNPCVCECCARCSSRACPAWLMGQAGGLRRAELLCSQGSPCFMEPLKHLPWGAPHGLASITIMGRIWRPPKIRFSKGQSNGDFPHDSLAIEEWIHLGHEDKLSLGHFLAVV